MELRRKLMPSLVDCSTQEENEYDVKINLQQKGTLVKNQERGTKNENSINSQQTTALQCPPCRWGTSYWWRATGPHTAGGRGAYTGVVWGGTDEPLSHLSCGHSDTHQHVFMLHYFLPPVGGRNPRDKKKKPEQVPISSSMRIVNFSAPWGPLLITRPLGFKT